MSPRVARRLYTGLPAANCPFHLLLLESWSHKLHPLVFRHWAPILLPLHSQAQQRLNCQWWTPWAQHWLADGFPAKLQRLCVWNSFFLREGSRDHDLIDAGQDPIFTHALVRHPMVSKIVCRSAQGLLQTQICNNFFFTLRTWNSCSCRACLFLQPGLKLLEFSLLLVDIQLYESLLLRWNCYCLCTPFVVILNALVNDSAEYQVLTTQQVWPFAGHHQRVRLGCSAIWVLKSKLCMNCCSSVAAGS